MSLKSALRKAAGLIVELPAEETQSGVEETSSSTGRSTGVPLTTPTAGVAATSSTDALWAELEQAARKTPASPPTKTVEQIVREGVGPSLDQIRIAPEALPQDGKPGSSLDFEAIYKSANLPAAPFTADQVLEMLAALPAELPLDTKRQMMKVSINAMGKAIGATPENIVADASRKLAALNSYTEHLSSNTNEYVNLAEQKIAQLQAQIEKTRQDIATKQQKLQQDTDACARESHRMDEVLEFFSLDVPPSKYAPTETQTP